VKKLRLLPLALVLPLLTLAAPAFAAPRQCSTSCTCTSSCSQLCSDGPHLSNCFDGGICVGQCLAASSSAADEGGEWSTIFATPQEAPASDAPAPAIP
jgi:hypothetical protein